MFTPKQTACFFGVLVWTTLLVTGSYGQTTGGTILGTVSDMSAARIAGAMVRVTNVETGISRTLPTDAAGRFRAPNLDPGNYEVQAELAGFRAAVRRGIQLTVAAELVVDLQLSVGAVTEQVVVTEQAPLVETTSAALSGLVDDKKIRDLPLNGRSFEQLAFLQAGVTPYYRGVRQTDQGEGTKFSVSGSRVDSNSFLLDGTNVSDQSNSTPGSAAGQLLGVEMLREFRVLTGAYSAEYGRYSGGIITAATKSGTNNLHGNLFYFHRNDNLDARDFFDRQDSPDDPRLPEFKRNQYGATVGGPIRRDQTHFFGGYEGLRERKGVSNLAIVPSADAHLGILPLSPTACQTAGGAARSDGTCQLTINPSVRPFLDLYPLPNGNSFPNGSAQLFSSPTRPVRTDYFMVRGDHKFSDSDFLFGRHTFDDSTLSSPDAYPTITVDAITRGQYATVEYKRIISPRVLNAARVGFNRSYSNQVNRPLFEMTPDLFFIPGQQLGLITFRGIPITEFGGGPGYPRRFGHNVYQFSDDTTVSLGSHALKMGFLYERTQSNATLSRVYGGQYYFNRLQDFLGGVTEEFSGDLPGTDTIRGWRQHLFGFYFQDDFQVRSNLTLNLGLRYEFTTVPTEVNGKISNFPNPLTDTAPTVGDPWYEAPKKDFAPRVGLSWDPWGNGKTAIRAGFGMYHDHLVAQPLNRALSRIPPYTMTARVLRADGPVAFPRVDPNVLRSPPLSSVVSYALQHQMQDPTKIGYSFSIQQEIVPQTVVTAAYSGAHSYHQLNGNNGNNRLPEIRNGQKYFAPGLPRRNPALGQLQFLITPEGSSVYHSLQLSANRRFSAGLQLQASYTYASFLSDAEAVFGRGIDIPGTVPQDPDNFGAERSLSSFGVRNYFALNYTYDLPLARNLAGVAGKVLSGWQINGILALANGTPFTVLTGFSRSRNGASGNQVTDRPNLLPDFVGKNLTEGVSAGCQGVQAGARLGTPEHWFDPCAFSLPDAGFYGNLGRNTVIAPGLANFDFALTKSTSLTENKSLQFRAEFFNLFNRVNFNRPGVVGGQVGEPIRTFDASGNRNGSAGAILGSLTTSRQIQLGLKLTF